MLKNLLSAMEPSKFILLKDDEDHDGRMLMKVFIRNALNRCPVTVITYDSPPENVKEFAANCEKLTILDGYTDPLGWDDRLGDGSSSLVDYDLKGFASGLRGLVVISSLTTVLLNNPIHKVYKTLHAIIKNKTVEQVFAVLHPSIHDESDVRHLEHLAQTVITMGSTESVCTILHKKNTGKIRQAREAFLVDGDLELSSQPVKDESISPEEKTIPKKVPDMTSNWTTFNLSLKDDEKVAREQLVLPYTSQKTGLQQTGGKIFYNLDEADDFDEEDPDEDLDV